MNTFRFFWTAHKWVGVSIALFLVLLSATGFLLLLKEYAWIQPPTQAGAAGTIDELLPLGDAWARVKATGDADFATDADLDRIDVRPGKRVYKFRSRHNHAEVQVDAVTGAILSRSERMSDWLETLHDGSWLGKPVHDVVMPLVAILLFFLVLSGLWLWISPFVRRRRRRAKHAAWLAAHKR